jgi:hypothetical protein
MVSFLSNNLNLHKDHFEAFSKKSKQINCVLLDWQFTPTPGEIIYLRHSDINWNLSNFLFRE